MTRVIWSALALLALGCGAGDGNDVVCDAYGLSEATPTADTPAASADVAKILEHSCAVGGCHAVAPGAGELSLPLSDGAWVDALVNQHAHENPELMLVAPGNPDDSWLMHKLSGNYCASTCKPPLGCGQRMPFGVPLAQAELDTVYAWILAGAPR